MARAGAAARPASWLRAVVVARRRDAAPTAGATCRAAAAGAPDAWHLFDLWTHATPPAIARIEGYGAADWESVGHEAIVPRSALNPILHFSEVDAWLLPTEQRAGGFAQHGACRDGPHYLRFLVRDGDRRRALPARGAARASASDAIAAGILSPVRTYESAGMRAAEAAGFEPIGRVTLLVREVRAQVRQPAMVPAIQLSSVRRGEDDERGTPRDDRRPRCPDGGAAARDRASGCAASPTGPTCSRS